MTKDSIAKLLLPYVHLKLECDGMTRVLSYVLKKNNVNHSVCTGDLIYDDQSIYHYWIKLSDGYYIDYRAQMWMGKNKNVPNGIFNPLAYPLVKYICKKNVNLNVSDFIFQLLTT